MKGVVVWGPLLQDPLLMKVVQGVRMMMMCGDCPDGQRLWL